MAYAVQWITEAELVKLCGTGASATVKAANYFEHIVIRVDAMINCITRFDWIAANTATALDASVKGLLAEASGCLCAIEGIIFDMSGYTSRVEAEDIINVLRDRALLAMSLLRNQEVKTFMLGA